MKKPKSAQKEATVKAQPPSSSSRTQPDFNKVASTWLLRLAVVVILFALLQYSLYPTDARRGYRLRRKPGEIHRWSGDDDEGGRGRRHGGGGSSSGTSRMKRRFTDGQSRSDVGIVLQLRSSWMPRMLIENLLDSSAANKIPVTIAVMAVAPFPEDAVSDIHPSLNNVPEVKVTYLKGRQDAAAQSFPVSLLEIMQTAVSMLPMSTTHFFFLSPTHVPLNPISLLPDMLQEFTHDSKLAILGCSAAMKNGKRTFIVDHGHRVTIGHSQGKERLFATRRHAGFTVNDSRFVTEEVPFVSVYCAMITRQALDASEFMRMPPKTYSDVAVSGLLSISNVSSFRVIVGILGYRLKTLDDLMLSLSMAEVTQGNEALRKAVQMGYKTDMEGVEVWEAASQERWRDVIFKPLTKAVLFEEQQHREWIMAAKTKAVKILRAVDMVASCKQTALQATKGSPAFGIAVEEEILWELSLRLDNFGMKTKISNVTMLVTSQAIPPQDVIYGVDDRLYLMPSLLLSKPFAEKWQNVLEQQHPMLAYLSSHTRNTSTSLDRNHRGNSDPSSIAMYDAQQAALNAPPRKLEIVWYAYCCRCCGFLNEIASLVMPLQHLQYVHLTPSLDCFCPGMPIGVQDTVDRMYVAADAHTQTQSSDLTVYISHSDPSLYGYVMEMKGVQPAYFIGRSMYEFSRIDAGFAYIANQTAVDEIWVPGEFVKNVYADSGVDRKKLVVIPEAVDTFLFDPERVASMVLPPQGKGWNVLCNYNLTRAENKARYKFLSDFKWEPRKGWEILFAAYFKEFTRSDPLSLYVLTHKHIWDPKKAKDKNNANLIQDEINEWLAANRPDIDTSKLPHYCLLSSDMSSYDIAELYNSVDAFVLPTRGEGWGLPSIQAMAMGLPTLCTNWGGNTEFMKPSNSFLIALDAVEEIPNPSVYGWMPGKKWATPSENHTAELMRLVFTDRVYAAAVGKKARAYVVEHFSEAAVARIIDHRLKQIYSKIAAPGWLDKKKQFDMEAISAGWKLKQVHDAAVKSNHIDLPTRG